MMSHKRFAHADTELAAGPTPRATGRRGRTPARIIGLLLVVLLAGDSAFADFLVQPMVVHLRVQPGRRYTQELKLENTDPKQAETLTLRPIETTQAPDGQWMHLPPDDPNLSKLSLRSCREWLNVPASAIKVGAYQIVPFTLTINVPQGVRGFYFAALMVASAPRDITTASGVVTPVSMQFMVPVILEIQGTPMQLKFEFGGVALQYQAATPDTPAQNNIFVDVINAGGTFSRLQPVVRIWNQMGNHWQWLSEVKYPELMAMPGAKLHLQTDAGQALPSGKYKLEVCLYVEGRRQDLFTKIVDFKSGDPSVTAPQGQVALVVQPPTVILDSLPGSARSQVLQVQNASEEDVEVKGELALPGHMRSMQIGQNIRGDDLGCQDWVTLNPVQFLLRGYARRSLTLLARMPKVTKYHDYYATLKLRLTYRDGKPAGTKEIVVCVQNKNVKDQIAVKGSAPTLAELSPSRYLVSAMFTNMGASFTNKLKCIGCINMPGAGGGGASTVKRFVMSSETAGQADMLLPIEARTFSGTLDISDADVEAGKTYYLTAILTCEGSDTDGIQAQVPIRVFEQGGTKKAQMENASSLTPLTIKL